MEYIEHKIRYLNKNRDILLLLINDKFDINSIKKTENFEFREFEYNNKRYLMIRYLDNGKNKDGIKRVSKYNYECAYEDHNYTEAIRLFLKYISMCEQLNAKDIYQVGKMYLNIKNYQLAQRYLLLASMLCDCKEYSDMYQYCLSKYHAKGDYKKDLISSDKLNLIINDVLLNIGIMDEVVGEYELTEDEKIMVKIYLVQELYKYGDKKRADKLLLDIKKINNRGDIVTGLLEYTEKNIPLITKQRKRILSKNED